MKLLCGGSNNFIFMSIVQSTLCLLANKLAWSGIVGAGKHRCGIRRQTLMKVKKPRPAFFSEFPSTSFSSDRRNKCSSRPSNSQNLSKKLQDFTLRDIGCTSKKAYTRRKQAAKTDQVQTEQKLLSRDSWVHGSTWC